MRERHVRRWVGMGAVVLLAALGSPGPAWAQDCGTEVGCQDGSGADLGSAPTEPVTGPTTTVAVPTTGATVPTAPTTPTAGASTTTAQVSPTTVNAGGTVTIRGSTFAPNSSLQMVLATTPPASLGTTQSDATGNFSATATIPASTPAGTYRLTVTGPGAQGGTLEASATVTVGLARTGVMTGVMTLVGAGALAAGAKLVLQSQWSRPVSTANWAPARRRRRS